MTESDRSETEEGDMDRLQLSSDSVDTILPKKRLRVEDSENETDLPAEKRQSFFSEQSRMVKNDNAETISDKNNINGCNIEEERYTLCPENEREVPETNVESKEKRGGLKRETRNESPQNENNVVLNDIPGQTNVRKEVIEKKDSRSQKSARNTSIMSTLENEKGMEGNAIVEEGIDETIDGKEDSEEEMRKRRTAKRCIVDTEVVDGLELSVECASDKDESSSESEGEKDVKPRIRTIIVKAEPNESELDCSSDGEKSDGAQRALVDTEIKSEKSRAKRRDSRTTFGKLKISGSEDSNSDEDYSPRTKKKMKKSSLTTRRLMNKNRSIESEGERVKSTKRNSHKKNTEYMPDEDEDVNATVINKADKTTKIKSGMEEELSEKESSSKDESDNNSEREENSTRDRRRRSNAKSQDTRIQSLKKYLSIAGVKVKSYHVIWADCKTNAAKIKRLKELLEKNGVSGRPTLEKCKRVREKNENMREVSELDTSNIISEGRITRARRSMENVKKTTPPDTPPRHRETRNTFRRIRTVVDSDSSE